MSYLWTRNGRATDLRFGRRAWLWGLVLGMSLGCQSVPPPRSMLERVVVPVTSTVEQVVLKTWDTSASSAEQWDAWAANHLETGDIVFIRSEIPVYGGVVDLADVVVRLQEGPYSHTGILVQTEAGPTIYDATRSVGVRQIPFSRFVGSYQREVGIKRLKAASDREAVIAQVVQFCEDAHRRQIPFDKRFELGEEALYCTELTVTAYRHAGVTLTEPIEACELPGYGRLSAIERQLQRLSPLGDHSHVYVPGNDEIGLWSSPWLEAVAAASTPNELIARSPGSPP